MGTSLHPSYSHTLTGVLGLKRETMLANELHLKDKMGRPRPHGYVNPYPGETFIYGMEYPKDTGGVREALHGWPGTDLSLLKKEKMAKIEKDYMTMNREATRAGMVTAPEHEAWRRTHNIFRRTEKEPLRKGKDQQGLKLPPNYTFGCVSRPPTPIFDLIEHKYQDTWIKQRRALEMAQREQLKAERVNYKDPTETRTSILRVHNPPVEPGKLWQMKRWNSAGPSLQTFRTDKSREDAFKARDTDRKASRGRLQGGVYTGASEMQGLLTN